MSTGKIRDGHHVHESVLSLFTSTIVTLPLPVKHTMSTKHTYYYTSASFEHYGSWITIRLRTICPLQTHLTWSVYAS